MEAPALYALAKEHLLPLFSGAYLNPEPVKSTARHECVALTDVCTIAFKVGLNDGHRLRISRSQPFDKLSKGRVTEKHVVEAFVQVVREIEPGLTAPYRNDLLSTFQRRVVAKAVSPSGAEQQLLLALDQLAKWATRLYEGKPISAAIGFVPDGEGAGTTLQDIAQHDFGAVLSNGYDTVMTFDFQGRCLGHESLPPPNPVPSYAPYRQAPLAAWSKDGRIAVALNRLGEILVFRDEMLIFARRSAKWHFLTHEPVVTQMRRPYDNWPLRQAIYESCLDASFARTGACIGVTIPAHRDSWSAIATLQDDHLKVGESAKSKAVTRMVGEHRFNELDRRLRQELMAIDGATILNDYGRILAVGAILKIPGGSTGGGRLAAAKALSSLGLGIKVSQDGGISGFHDGEETPKFQVM